ncbi:MAG TPA: tetratricopeptide repeat protein [bacterium]|nr:tetratricopeptide repeat protein [bacterium]HPQ65870.1 tetratricopeptide repeat protein [bacterium]
MVAGGSIYLPALRYPLLWDDVRVVRDNSLLRGAESPLLYFQPDFWRWRVPISRNDYRPLQMLALSVPAWWGGADPAPYRCANILVNALATVAVFLLAFRVGGSAVAALVAAALYAVHPAHVEAVVNPRNISELLPSLFMTLVLAGLLSARPPGALRIAGLSLIYAAALLTKETALILPPLVVFTVLLRAGWKRAWRLSLPFWGLALVSGAWKAVMLKSAGLPRPGNLVDYPPDMVRLWARYLQLLIFPVRLKTLYSFRLPVYWGGWLWLLPLLGAVAFLLALGRVRRRRGIFWAGAGLTISLLPALSKVAQAGRTVAEQRLYFPSVFGCILAGLFLAPLLSGGTCRRRRWAGTVLGIVLVALTLGSVDYLWAWKSEFNLWLRASIYSPRASLAYNNLAIAYHVRGDDRAAIGALREALTINPRHCEAHNNLGVFYRNRGALKKAVRHFEQSLSADPLYHVASLNLAETYLRMGRIEEAETIIRSVVAANPWVPEAYNALGIALEREARFPEAAEAYRKAGEINREYAVPLRNLALLLQERGRFPEALAAAEEALRRAPRHPTGFAVLARLYVGRGLFAEARSTLRRGLRLNPGETKLKTQLLALPPPTPGPGGPVP